MEENVLVKVLIAVGIISLCIISISNLLLRETTSKFLSELVSVSLCEKNYEGEYILGKPTSYEVCDKVDDISDMIENPTTCNGFKSEKRRACWGLIEIAKKRESDCVSLLFRQTITSVNPEDVKTYCKILNATLSD